MKNTLCFLHFLLFSTAFFAQRIVNKSSNTYAIIIGISDYQDEEITDLKYSAQDALSFAAYLKSKAGGQLTDAQLRMLIDEQATVGQIVSGLEWLVEVSKQGDKVFVYFSGYGLEESLDPAKPLYLVPYDVSASVFMPRAFPYRRLKRILTNWAHMKGIDLIMLMDSYLLKELKEPEEAKLYVNKDTVKSFEMTISAATAPHTATANLIQLNERITFTSLLLEGLIGLADEDGNQNISVLEAGNYVKSRVPYSKVAKSIFHLMAKTSDISITNVHPDILKLEEKRKSWLPPIAHLETDGYERSVLAKVDTATQYLYQDFVVAIELNNLLNPPGHSANDLLIQVEQETDYSKLKSSMRRKLTAALQDETQKAINDYLKTDSREMAIRWAYRDHYDHFPKYLQRAAELLSKKHYLYQSIKAKEYYFRGLTMRLEAIGKSNEKELMSAALDTQRVALIYENQAAFIYNEIGVIHSELEQWDSSVYYFNIATEWAPRWSIPWSNLCLVYTEMGNYEKAIECGNEAIKVEPRYVTAYNHMGIVYLDMKDYRTAESYFRKAIEKDETYPISYYNLSCTKALRGQRQASLKWLEMAIKWGYNDFELMEKDQDLDNVRGMKRFENLVESLSSDKNRD